MTAADIYSQYVIRRQRAALMHWETQRTNLVSASAELKNKLEEAVRDPDQQIQTVKEEIKRLEEQLAGLRKTLQAEISDLKEKCETQRKRNEAAKLKEIFASAEWILPKEELMLRPLNELERYLSDRADKTEADKTEVLRKVMRASLSRINDIICSHPDSEGKVSEFERRNHTLDAEISRIRDELIRNHEVEPAVLDSLSQLDTSPAARFQVWMKERCNDAEIERSWGTPEQVFSVLK